MAEDGIAYDDERLEKAKNVAMAIKNSIEITTLSNILEYSEIFWDVGEGKLETTINDDKGMLDVYKKFASLDTIGNKCRSDSPWVLRMKFNKDKMNSYGLRMIDIYTKLNKAYNKYVDCVYSDDNADECIFRIKLTEHALKDIDNKDEIAALKAMEHNIVYQVLLKGIKGINKVSLNKTKYDIYNEEEEIFEKVVEWVLDTDGTNLAEILSNPNIDSTRTISNDIREIYTVLGIEAARNALYNELVNVTGEGSMNYRHLSLLIDTMTFRGNLMSIDRHGINRNASSALSKSSFEESVDMLINASIFSEYDNTSGVSPQVMLGKVPKCGSGNFDIILDEEHLIELLKSIKQTKENKYELDNIDEEENDDDVECIEENLTFNMPKNEIDKCYSIENPKINIIRK
jgi:DNA-directed RNA polymerase II subunit RPB1